MERLSFLASGVAKPWQGRVLEGSGVWGMRFGLIEFGSNDRHFWPRRSRILGKDIF